MKRLLSLLTALIITVTGVISFPCSAFAASYEDVLRAKGFPESYVQKLTALHNKYPNWIFEPLITNIDWQTAVNGERSSHSKQLIQNISSYDASMFCRCSSCYVNGKYVVQESGNWVSASETAVQYYMDPRNWLDEQHIFQFESTAYDGTQTKAGVEAILDGTWMHDSLITYRTTGGSVKLYDSTTKYSDVIMKAANDSGMSAYYLASKIRQENGGATASASAVNGTVSPFQGIYNYFNIGAYSGASDGLAWAAGFLKLNNNSKLYSDYDTATGMVKGTSTTLKAGQYMTWRANKGNYYYVRLYTESNGKYIEGASGYVLKSDCRTTYLGDTDSGLGRPWTNPYKAIYYGAKYIARSFKTQSSGYLQKFNVNPASSSLYTNEYMKNVAAASSEAVTTYNGYAKANILGITKKFVIPVFKNMPNDVVTTGLALSSLVDNNATLVWDSTYGATSYQVQLLSNGQWVDYAVVPIPSLTVYGIAPNNSFTFRVRAVVPNGSSVIYGTFSNEVTVSTVIPQVKGVKATSGNDYVTLKWTPQQNVSGYSVYIYNSSKKKYVYHKDVSGGNKSSLKLTKLTPNKTYKYKVLAYVMFNGTKYDGPKSSAVSIKTKNNVVTLSSAKSSKTKKITVKWKKVSGVTGYEVMWSTSSNFKKNFLSVKVKGSSSLSKTLTTAKSKKTYYVRVRAYKTTKGKTTYYPWSSKIKVKVK
ncbi:MAG: fibronectin type III domain-containing protein [Eubacterium sp.]